MAVLIASGLAKDMAGSPLLRGVALKLERRERLTLSGRNGSGKTTLLRMLAGETSIDGGELVLQKGARVALHDQRPPRERDLSLRDYVLSGCSHLIDLEDDLRAMENAMAGGEMGDAMLGRYSAAQAALEHAGGYGWRGGVTGTLRGLGFSDSDLDRHLDTFSGGELTRASLARALAVDPDLLLLDEPTNHLDVESLEWLERKLTSIDAAVVLVAHDRWFLEAVGTAVLELEAGRSRFFPGTWHAWRKEKAARELALGRAVERQQAEIERLDRFVTRFRAGTRAKQAQARAKKLAKITPIERERRDKRDVKIGFEPPGRSGRVVLEMEHGVVAVPGRTLLADAELWLERGEHVSLVGPNGTGKTTLIETLAGRREPDGGKLRRGHNVELGYLSQHAEELDDTATVLVAAQRATGLKPGPTRALLGRFLFSGQEAEKPVAGLSGGERRRLSLAVLVSSGANLLVLDEPTNHLDLESREALEDALRSFSGSVLLVSHDRALLDAVGTRTIAVEDGKLRSYEGGWADYVRVRDERQAAEREAAAEPSPSRSSNGKKASTSGAVKEPSKNAKRAAEKLEKEIGTAEAALQTLEDELADPSAWSDPKRSAESSRRHEEAKERVAGLYERWEKLSVG